jgi:hypothetical protein
MVFFKIHQRIVSPASSRRRRGTSMFEVFVALTLLVTVLSVSTTLIVKHNHLLVSARHYRLACDELTNQLETLTSLPPDELPAALEEVNVSAFTAERLHDAKLSATLADADFGQRLTLSLTWDEPGRREAPLTLAAWIPPSAESSSLPSDEPSDDANGDPNANDNANSSAEEAQP